MRHFHAKLSRLPKWYAVFFAFALVGFVGWLDYITGFDVGLTGLYLLPLCWVSWVAGRKAGFIMAVTCAAVAGTVNHLTRHADMRAGIPIWNGFMLLVVCLIAMYALTSFLDAYQQLIKAKAALHEANTQLEKTVQQRTASLSDEIAERKQAEKAVRASEERLAFALETSGIGAWDLDLENHTILRSCVYDQIFGYPQPLPLWTYRTFLNHVVPEDRAALEANLQAAMAQDRDWTQEFRIRRADGEERCLWAAGRQRQGANAQRTFLAGIVQDITMRKRLEQAERLLERQEKLATLGTLTAGIAHEIRNPLTSLKARLYTLEKHLSILPAARQDADIISSEIVRLERIVQDALSFARPADPKLEPFAADMLLHEVHGLMAAELERQGVRLVLEGNSQLIVRADSGHMKQVLINLVRNAADAIEGAGTVTLRSRAAQAMLAGQDTEAVLLEVSDTGKGMPPEVEKRLFDPFFTTKDTGIGLGLPIAARIVEKHGGIIQYDNRLRGGTTFRVVLPREKNGAGQG